MRQKEDFFVMAHLMRRAGFGATREELDWRVAAGYEATVEELLNPTEDQPRADIALMLRYHPDGLLYGGDTRPAQTHWMYSLLNTQRPLEEKMALFWHQVFATGNAKVDNSDELVEQVAMFRDRGMGNYKDLLVEVAKSPAMIFWLDNNENHRDGVNENWGRELLELFSMGVGNYSEIDVRECARSFTGWTISPRLPRLPYRRFPWKFEFKEEDHDYGEKTFLGHTGEFNGEDIIDIVVQQPATARFVCRHLYNFFVADEVQVPAWTIEPARDEETLAVMIDAFQASGYEIKPVLRTLFNSEAFKKARFSKIKSPVEVVVNTVKLAGAFQFPDPGILEIGVAPTYQGQALLDPPSVEGWQTGHEWINSGSLLARINFVADWVTDFTLPGVQNIIADMKAAGVVSPEELLDASLEHMGFIELMPDTRRQLLEYAQERGNVDWSNRSAAGIHIGEMLAAVGATTEYQFS